MKAMGYDVPVIASSATSIPEVCADAACYFSPTSIDDLCNRILQLYYDEDLRIKLSQQGRKRVAELLEIQRKSLDDMFEYLFGKNV